MQVSRLPASHPLCPPSCYLLNPSSLHPFTPEHVRVRATVGHPSPRRCGVAAVVFISPFTLPSSHRAPPPPHLPPSRPVALLLLLSHPSIRPTARLAALPSPPTLRRHPRSRPHETPRHSRRQRLSGNGRLLETSNEPVTRPFSRRSTPAPSLSIYISLSLSHPLAPYPPRIVQGRAGGSPGFAKSIFPFRGARGSLDWRRNRWGKASGGIDMP